MNQGMLPSHTLLRALPSAHGWLVLFVLALGLAGGMEYLGAKELAPGQPLEQLFSYKLTAYAHLLLLASTVLYLAHLRFPAHAVGLWASSLALLGAGGLLGALVLRGAETYVTHSARHVPLTSLHEVMSLFSAFTVLIYLVMERAYRTRSAGAFVLPIVAVAVLGEAWLIAGDAPGAAGNLPLLRSYAVRAHVLAHVTGYGAFAVAAAMGLMLLLRERALILGRPRSMAARGVLPAQHIEQLMHRSVLLGFPLFSLAIVLGMYTAYQAWGRLWTWQPKEAWALVVWLGYAVYVWLYYGRRWHGHRMAYLAIAAFALTVAGFVGVNLLFARQHQYG